MQLARDLEIEGCGIKQICHPCSLFDSYVQLCQTVASRTGMTEPHPNIVIWQVNCTPYQANSNTMELQLRLCRSSPDLPETFEYGKSLKLAKNHYFSPVMIVL